jgi:hypothetical protein
MAPEESVMLRDVVSGGAGTTPRPLTKLEATVQQLLVDPRRFCHRAGLPLREADAVAALADFQSRVLPFRADTWEFACHFVTHPASLNGMYAALRKVLGDDARDERLAAELLGDAIGYRLYYLVRKELRYEEQGQLAGWLYKFWENTFRWFHRVHRHGRQRDGRSLLTGGKGDLAELVAAPRGGRAATDDLLAEVIDAASDIEHRFTRQVMLEWATGSTGGGVPVVPGCGASPVGVPSTSGVPLAAGRRSACTAPTACWCEIRRTPPRTRQPACALTSWKPRWAGSWRGPPLPCATSGSGVTRPARASRRSPRQLPLHSARSLPPCTAFGRDCGSPWPA